MSWLSRMDVHYKEWILVAICIISIAVGIFFYPRMPEMVVSHWGADGVPNGFMNAFWGSFIMPAVIAFMVLLLIFIPRADPLSKNIDTFKISFLNFSIILVLFMFILQIFTILWNLNFKINIAYVIIPAFAVLFYFMGIMLGKAKQNMTIGIRTPWTLKSKTVWDETHRRTGALVKLVSVIFLLGLVFPKQAFIILLVPLFAVFLYSFIYSYVLYEKEKRTRVKYKKKE